MRYKIFFPTHIVCGGVEIEIRLVGDNLVTLEMSEPWKLWKIHCWKSLHQHSTLRRFGHLKSNKVWSQTIGFQFLNYHWMTSAPYFVAHFELAPWAHGKIFCEYQAETAVWVGFQMRLVYFIVMQQTLWDISEVNMSRKNIRSSVLESLRCVGSVTCL